ncbi:MAG: hypothetical protein ACREOQ_18100 [Gemmatimonadales bacterium]
MPTRAIHSIAAACLAALCLLVPGCGENTAPQPISISVLPEVANLPVGGTQAFSATVENDPADKGVTWTASGDGCTGAACGMITPTGSASGVTVTYTAPATAPAPAAITITATSAADNSKLDIATVTIDELAVSVSPASPSVEVSQTAVLTARVDNDPAGQGVTWMLTGSGCTNAACGTIGPAGSAGGLQVTYTAPSVVPSPATVTLTATSVTDNSKTAFATITIVPPSISVSVSPASASPAVNTTQDFTAVVTNDATGTGVTWSVTGSCSDAACGSIAPVTTASGATATYTAPATVPNPAGVRVTATSIADNSRFATATVTIYSEVSVSISPARVGVDVNAARQFTASVSHDGSHSGVTWSVSGEGCSGPACGTVAPASSASGEAVTYTAPAAAPNPAQVAITATALADVTKTGSADVAITTPGVITVAVFPPEGSIATGGATRTRSFAANVFHDPTHSGVTWSVSTGSISPTTSDSGEFVVYTAPSHASGSATITASSVADPSRFGTARVFLINSCPLVYSWDGTTWRLDSGTFGGAIARALARTDVDNLDFATPQDGILRLRLANEWNETEYVDRLAVLAVDHDSGLTVAPDGAGALHSVGPLTLPVRARDFRGEDVLTRISAADGRSWESSPLERDTAVAADLRDGIELGFPKPSGSKAARLVLDGNNTHWAAQMMYAFVSAHGRATQPWYDSLDAAPERARRMFAVLARDAFLRVSVWKRGHWEQQGLITEAPPELRKRQVLALDLRGVSGDIVRVRLESVPSFWALDQVALDFSAEHPVTATELVPTTAIDDLGQDVRGLLADADTGSFVMEQDDFAELRYEVPAIPPGRSRTYLLRSTGWYRIHTPEIAEPDVTLLDRVLREPRAISRISIARMNEVLRAVQASAR